MTSAATFARAPSRWRPISRLTSAREVHACSHDTRAIATPPLPIATMLTPNERLRVDAAGEGSYRALHRDSVAEVVQDLKSNRASAVARLGDAMRPERARRRRRARARVSARSDRRAAHAARSHRRRTPCCRSDRPAFVSSSTSATPTGGASCATTCSSTRGEDIQRQALGQLAIDLSGVPQRLLALLRGAVPRAAARVDDSRSSRDASTFFQVR